MIKSMTGFGKATGEVNQKKITAEIKSLNSKQTDISVRLSNSYKEKELDLRSLINQQLNRGKIELNLYVELLDDESNYQINKGVFEKYYQEIFTIANQLDADTSTLLSAITQMPDVLQKQREDELDEKEWNRILSVIQKAIHQLDNFRINEGTSLETELSLRISNITNLLTEVDSFEKERIKAVKDRIHQHLKDNIGIENINNDRFEQELIFYIEKFDVTEEKTRLSTHCNYFLETMNSSISEGKKLGFISQEIGREINTLGAKANNAGMQKIVVQMKDELEKIKEQILNIL